MDKRIEEIEEALKHPDFLTRQENGLLLNKHQIQVLEQYKINWKNHTSLASLLFEIEEILSEEEIEDLELLGRELQEFHYYHETRK